MNLPAAHLACFVVLVATACPVGAQPPGKGFGAGKGGHGHGHGRMSETHQGVIHALFAEHDKVKRVVELTDEGYRARTTSKDPKVAGLIQDHVSQMESRLEGGLSVRHWDPAFAELREHYESMSITWEKIEGGIAVSVVGRTPEAVAVARNHAKIISEFVKEGGERSHETHAAVLEKAESGARVGGCEKCEGGKNRGKGGCSCGKAGIEDEET